MVHFKNKQNLSSGSSTRISWFLIHLGILQKFQKTNKGHSSGKNCEVQTRWIPYLQLIRLILILSKTASSCQVSKDVRNWKKKNHVIHLDFINMFLSLLQKKIAISFSWQKKKNLCKTFNVEAHNVLIKK